MCFCGIPVENIEGINDFLIDRFKEYGINTVEGFLSICRYERSRKSLRDTLKLNEWAFRSLILRAQKTLPATMSRGRNIPTRSNRRYPFGVVGPKKHFRTI